ncbi:hypothetical protein [Amycolatopsis cihanbeyliensis]|uniref:hypothetical protein n=1 Tax=Amycolatopsis cihanbeyliensis TaxID=1128664 RepID=UPI001B8637FF|nr:hypothetical protein [Amycolatopsis cihanbeyliensis]
MFDLGLLANPTIAATAVAVAAIVVVLVPLLVYLPSYLISVVGLSPGQAGVWLLMLTAPTVFLPSVGSGLARRVSSVPLVAGSVAATGLGALLLVTIGPDSSPPGLLVSLLLTGAGFGLSTGIAVVGALLAALSGGTLAGPGYTTTPHTVCLLLGGFAAAATLGVIVLSRRAVRAAPAGYGA